MTDKQAAIQVLNKLPDDISLKEIASEIQIMAAVQKGREDVKAGRIKSHAEATKLMQSWSLGWNVN